MDDIWQQFHRLPKAIRDAVAAPSALAAVDRLEAQYPRLDLASFIIRAMVKEFPVSQLPRKLQDENGLSPEQAENVASVLSKEVFEGVKDYLEPGSSNVSVPAPAKSEPIAARPVQINAVPPKLPPLAPKPPVPTAAGAPVRPVPQPIKSPVPAPSPARPAVVAAPVSRPPVPALQPGSMNVAPTQAYSDDDAQEIQLQSDKLKELAARGATMDFDDVSKEVMAQHHLAWGDELLAKRALAIFKARLKDIRSSNETREMMTRVPKVGGLGMDPDLAGLVVATLDEHMQDLKRRGMVKTPEPVPAPPPPKVPTMVAQHPEPLPPLTRNLPPDNLPVAPAKTLPNVTDAPRLAPPIKRPADIPPPPPPSAVKPPEPAPVPVVQRMRVIDRPTIADIKRPVKVVGPAEEMKTMTLTEFRRLGQGAADSARRLLDKFQHLQSESFSLWAEAVTGWRQSEVYRLYLEMGRQSLDQGTPVSEIVQQRAKANQLYLSEHEFMVVADLNRQLQL